MFEKYFENGYSVIPVFKNGKNPILKEWTKYCKEMPSQELVNQWTTDKYNIGITCGPASGIVVVDIDSDNKEMLDLIPPSPVRRRGKKGECRVFRYNGEKSISLPGLDILSDGRQFLVPPSIHPETHQPYVWLTPDTLENFKHEDLPLLNLDFLEHFKKSTTVVHTKEGRNNKLRDIVSAMRGRNESEIDIVNEIYNWDRNYHNPRLFNDKSHGFYAKDETEAKSNAWLFSISVTTSLVKSKTIRIDNDEVIISLDESKPIIPSFIRREYPMPMGIMGDIQNVINGYSEREIGPLALGASIAMLGSIFSNRFRFDNCWPNVYILNLAPTGAGKSFPQTIIKMLLDIEINSGLMGYGNYRSSAAFSKNLVSKRERLDVIDEISSLFAHIKDGGLYQTEIAQEMCKVWSDSNTKYIAGEYAERQDTGTCFNPCVSILGSSTIEGIKNQINRYTVQCGLLPRFIIFSQENYGKVKNNTLDRNLLSKITKQLKSFLTIEKRINRKAIVDKLIGPIYDPVDMTPINKDAIEYFDALKKDFYRKIENESDESIKEMLTRGKEQIMKLSLIHAAGCGKRNIELFDLTWAQKTFEASLHNIVPMLSESSSINDWERDVNKILNFIKKSSKLVSLGDLTRQFKSIQKKKIVEIMDQLTISETVLKSESSSKTRIKTGWVINDA